MSLLEADNEDQLGPEEDSDFDSEDTKELKEEPKQEEPEQKEPKQEQPKQESKEELQGNKNDVDADDYTPWVKVPEHLRDPTGDAVANLTHEEPHEEMVPGGAGEGVGGEAADRQGEDQPADPRGD